MIHDYNKYQLSRMENIKYLLQGLAGAAIIGVLFYQSIFGILAAAPIIWFYRRSRINRLLRERKWKLNLEFKDGILALSAALEAGYSAENSFEQAARDLHRLYGEASLIVREFSYISNQIRMNITIERALHEFGERTGVEDILSFCEVFHTAKRTGGNLIHIIRNTSSVISDKIEIKREILTLITGKQLEANIMKLMPLLILIYLSFSSPGFLNPLYHNLFGMIIMTLFLAGYLGATLVIDRIVDIEV